MKAFTPELTTYTYNPEEDSFQVELNTSVEETQSDLELGQEQAA
jgi:hypothetical protein